MFVIIFIRSKFISRFRKKIVPSYKSFYNTNETLKFFFYIILLTIYSYLFQFFNLSFSYPLLRTIL